jgi:hypothetical protein
METGSPSPALPQHVPCRGLSQGRYTSTLAGSSAQILTSGDFLDQPLCVVEMGAEAGRGAGGGHMSSAHAILIGLVSAPPSADASQSIPIDA